MKAVAHFSCGVTSAWATKLALDHFGYDSVEIVYADTGSEHPDNRRFLHDCEALLWSGKEVTIVRSAKFGSVDEVFEARRYLAGVEGAPCTTELKKIPIRDYLGLRIASVVHVLGFDAAEQDRVERWRSANFELQGWFPLFDRRLTKQECADQVMAHGVDLPEMYKLGFPNANCIGCVKAENLEYWRLTKKVFPEVFARRADQERRFGAIDEETGLPRGAAINKIQRKVNGERVRKRVFLDELHTVKGGRPMNKLSVECGYSCGTQQDLFLEAVK